MRRKLKMEVSRKPFDSHCWPGGYPLFYLFRDGTVFCPDCVNSEIDTIDADTRSKFGASFELAAVDVHYEGEPLICEHCNADIESAYGSPDWSDSGEGPFDSEEMATDFAEAECGVEWRVKQIDGLWHVETRSEY